MKISPEFEQRLETREPDSTVQVLLLIALPFDEPVSSPKARRRNVQEAIRNTAAVMLPEIDRVLTHFGGRRLADRVDALGSLPVETTPDGIKALADISGVRAILENQAVLPMQ